MKEYSSKLSKIKTRTKRSHTTEDASSSESTPKSRSDSSFVEVFDDVDDISQAKTPQAKSSLLQKKLAEDRKIFEQRSKELTESKRAVEEKVEALRQQLEEKYVSPVTPVLVTSQVRFSYEYQKLPNLYECFSLYIFFYFNFRPLILFWT